MIPAAGLIDHVTALLDSPDTVSENCCVCPAESVTDCGTLLTETVTGGAGVPAPMAAATALLAFTRPQPKVVSNPGAPKSSVFCSSIEISAELVSDGFTASISAATPAVIGD